MDQSERTRELMRWQLALPVKRARAVGVYAIAVGRGANHRPGCMAWSILVRPGYGMPNGEAQAIARRICAE